MVDTQDIKTRWVTVPSQDVELDAYLAEPTEEGNVPAIVVIQEIFGVNSHIRDVTERFARLGYVAIAPAIYQRQAPGFETGYTPEDVTLGRQYKTNTDASELLNDIAATVRYLQDMPTVRSGAIGSIGLLLWWACRLSHSDVARNYSSSLFLRRGYSRLVSRRRKPNSDLHRRHSRHHLHLLRHRGRQHSPRPCGSHRSGAAKPPYSPQSLSLRGRSAWLLLRSAGQLQCRSRCRCLGASAVSLCPCVERRELNHYPFRHPRYA